MKTLALYIVTFIVILALLAFVPIDVLGSLILVVFAIAFLVVIIMQNNAWKKEDKDREEFYRELWK